MMNEKYKRSKRSLGVVVRAKEHLTKKELEEKLSSCIVFNKLIGKKMTDLALITNKVEKGKQWVICRKFISETNKNDPEDSNSIIIALKQMINAISEQPLPYFPYLSLIFPFNRKKSTLKKNSETKDEEVNPHEERKLGIEEYRSLVKFDEKNKERLIQKQKHFGIKYLKTCDDVAHFIDFTSYTEGIFYFQV